MCSYQKICGVTIEKDAEKTRANRGSNIDGSAVRYMQLKDAEYNIKVEKAQLKEDIKSGLIQRNTNKVMVGDIEINLSITKGRLSLNRKAVAAAGINLSPFETVGAPSERLTVKRA